MNPPIDLVYLWVDGADPAWCEKKNNFIREANATEVGLAIPLRWRDNDELRFSLRSAEMFAPWLNHIFLVTDGQCPAWLKRDNPRLTVVDHRDFIPERYLPLFTSEAIETFLPLIPGLSEHFLFANDDMFWGRAVSPERYFDKKGDPIVSVKRLSREDFVGNDVLCDKLLSSPGNASRARANILVSQKFGRVLNWEAGHVIDPCRKSYMLEALEEPAFAEAFEVTRNRRFRSPDAVQRIIFPLYDYCRGRTTLKDIRRFREIKRIFAPHRLPMYLSQVKDLQKALRICPEMFCFFPEMFDSFDGDSDAILHDFYLKYFPQKSSFEK